MDNNAPNEDVPDKTKALEWPDSAIYRLVGFHTQATFMNHEGDRENMCFSINSDRRSLRPYELRPRNLPFTRGDLQDFVERGLPSLRGYWSVLWHSVRWSNDTHYFNDDFRSVFVYNTIEFMIRPVIQLRDADVGQPKRLYIGCLDVRECLRLALEANPGPNGEMTMVMGQGYAKHSEGEFRANRPDIHFEWRIDRALETRINHLVEKWRFNAFGSAREYRDAKKAHDEQVKMERWLAERASNQSSLTSQPGALFRQYIPPSQPQQGPAQVQPSPAPQEHTPSRRKRRNESWGGHIQAGRSHKRRSRGSPPPSSSTDMLRQPSAMSANQASTQPLQQTQVSSAAATYEQAPAGSQRPYTGSDSADHRIAQVTSGFSGMAITSPDSSFIQQAPAYGVQGQGYGQSGQYHQQLGLGQGPPPKGYGDDIIKSAADYRRDRGIMPGTVQYMVEESRSFQAASQPSGLYQPQHMPPAQGAYTNKPALTQEQLQNMKLRAFGSALAQTQAEADRNKSGQVPTQTLQGPPPPPAAPQSEQRGQGASAPQAPQNRYGGYQPSSQGQGGLSGGSGSGSKTGLSGGSGRSGLHKKSGESTDSGKSKHIGSFKHGGGIKHDGGSKHSGGSKHGGGSKHDGGSKHGRGSSRR